ncbi:MAG: putative DNA binding domain-containing protein [Treponemataceae bacterium]|nr:putative DNA binding domain-containing protein [Treponemataceae bacterium]
MNINESANLELKRQFTDEIKKEVVAFANTAGGIIYVGVNDDGSVCGVENVDDEMLRLSSSIRQAIKPDITMFVSYITEVLEDKNVIKITVQRGNARPYYLANKGMRSAGVYVRHGSESVMASEAAIFKMTQETGGERYEEQRSLDQKLTFVELSRQFAARNISFTGRDKRRLGLITAEGQYTNLALLLSDQCTHTIKAALFEGNDTKTFKDRREFGGSLLTQLNDVYEWIDFHNCISSSFTGLYRTDLRDFPPVAVRESLLNAIVHRDYSLSASILIHIFKDRFEIISVGGLVEGLRRDDIMLGVSAARNTNLSKVFYRLMLVEAYGSGLPRIFASYKDELPVETKFTKMPSPQISVSDNAFKLMLPNMNEWQKSTVSDAEISPAQAKHRDAVLAFAEKRGFITRHDLQIALGISQSLAVRLLRDMTKEGTLVLLGKGPSTRYLVSKKITKDEN